MLEDEKPPKKKKKLTDNIAVIMLTGILVVAAVVFVVHLLNFQKAIQQLFTICTIAFVAVTIIDDMFRKGFFDSGDSIPDEQEFDQMIYELGRATESRTVRIEIDKNFQDAHDAKLELLKFKEHDAIAKRDTYYQLKEKNGMNYKNGLMCWQKSRRRLIWLSIQLMIYPLIFTMISADV